MEHKQKIKKQTEIEKMQNDFLFKDEIVSHDDLTDMQKKEHLLFLYKQDPIREDYSTFYSLSKAEKVWLYTIKNKKSSLPNRFPRKKDAPCVHCGIITNKAYFKAHENSKRHQINVKKQINEKSMLSTVKEYDEVDNKN